jgi:hypothetical protein
MRILLVVLGCLMAPISQAGNLFPCATVAEQAGKDYEANAAWFAVPSGRLNAGQWDQLSAQQGWTLLAKHSGQLIFQTLAQQPLFESCHPLHRTYQLDKTPLLLKLLPVLKNRAANRYAIVLPKLMVTADDEEALKSLEQDFLLKLQFKLPPRPHSDAVSAFFGVSETADLDEIIPQLLNRQEVSQVKPVLQESRYHLR